jgi:phosphoglycolate phosphatase-like HAD superfamily hydrolase
MFYEAAQDHALLLDRVLYVGDDIRDCQAAAAAGCGMIFLADATVGHDLPASRHHQSVHESFMGALEVIRSYYDGRSDS